MSKLNVECRLLKRNQKKHSIFKVLEVNVKVKMIKTALKMV